MVVAPSSLDVHAVVAASAAAAATTATTRALAATDPENNTPGMLPGGQYDGR